MAQVAVKAQVQCPAWHSGLKDPALLQDSIPGPGNLMCHGCGQKKRKARLIDAWYFSLFIFSFFK